MLSIHSNRNEIMVIGRTNSYTITVQEFLDGNLLKMDFNSIMNVLIQNQTMWKADMPLIGMSSMPQVSVGIIAIGQAMRLIAQLLVLLNSMPIASGFWQIRLSTESRHLTPFLMPYGRYCFNKLPFGISSAPELFQKRMNSLLVGLEGVLCLVYDIYIY